MHAKNLPDSNKFFIVELWVSNHLILAVRNCILSKICAGFVHSDTRKDEKKVKQICKNYQVYTTNNINIYNLQKNKSK